MPTTRFAFLVCVNVLVVLVVNAAETVQISTRTVKQEYSIAEPVVIQVVQRNRSEVDQQVRTELSMGGVGATYYYVASNGTDFVQIEAAESGDPSGRTITLGPGEVYVHDQIILYDMKSGRLLFADPGEYCVRVQVPTATGNSQMTESVRFRIVRPTRKEDIDASKAMQQREVLQAVTPWHGRQTIIASNALLSVAQGQSVYASYASLFLGELESENPKQALKWLERADVKGFVLRDRAVFLKAAALLKLSQIDKAQEQFDRIRKEFPESDALSELRVKGKWLLSEANRMQVSREQDQAAKVEAARWRSLPTNDAKVFTGRIEEFLRAHWRGDTKACIGTLSDDFITGSGETREQVASQFVEHAAEMSKWKPTMDITASKMNTDGTNVVGEFHVTSTLEGRGRKEKMKFGFRKKNDKWLITKWQTLDSDEKVEERERAIRKMDEEAAR